MRKRLITFSLLAFYFFGCTVRLLFVENPASNPLPTKTNADSTLMSESVINVSNLDDYPF
jgi:hypothetical protein